ncbi:hypothetical protein SAMN05444407_10250 [Chryseobacterium contaminans]|nr:hypothetical protein SAMN05444407_10250 [Chryseobacterium contaminans]
MMKTNSILRYALIMLFFLVSGKMLSQEMVSLPMGGCGRLLDTNTSAQYANFISFLPPCAKIGAVAVNASNMTDIDVNSYASLKPGIGAGICPIYVGVGTTGSDFPANKPVYIDFSSEGFNFNASFNDASFRFYNNGNEVYSTPVGGHFFFDFGDSQSRKIIKVMPNVAWDEIRLSYSDFGIGFTFNEMRVYNVLSEYYIDPMTYLSQPSDRTVPVGGSTTMTAVISNTDIDETPANVTYQWQILNGSTWTDLANGANYSNVTGSTLNINNIPAGFNNNQYRVVAKSSFYTCSFQANSNVGRLFVNAVNNPGTIGTDQTVCLDINADPAAFTVTAAAQVTGNAEYQWQSSTDNVTFTNITNATAATYDAPAVAQTTYYRRGVRSTLNGNVTAYQYSNVVKVTLKKSCLIKCIITNRMITAKPNSN